MDRAISLPCGDFRLGLTMESGQIFYEVAARDGGFWFPVAGEALWMRQGRPGKVETLRSSGRLAKRYFALDHPMDEILASFPRDRWLDAAREFCAGMRILRQPVWECVATFITSAQKQVWHIRRMARSLRERHGERLGCPDGSAVFCFPGPEVLAALSEGDLRECGLGYRAAHLLGAARKVCAGAVDLEAIRGMDDDAARDELCRLPGVGEKVANCVLLFAYERVRSFPVDVWIGRVLKERYLKRRRRVTPAVMKEFASSYFGPYAGYAQQFLFHHARMTWRVGKMEGSE